MRFGSRWMRFTCLLLIPSIAPFAAETADSPSPLPKTVAVAAFKNGLAFMIRQGEVPVAGGIGRISPIPNATLGTLWLSTSTPDSRLDEIVAYRYKTWGERAIPSIGEILQANAGKVVTIDYQAKDYTGEVVGLRDSPETSSGPLPEPDPNIEARSSYLLLRVNKSLMAFPIGAISLATFPEDAVLRQSVEHPGQALRFTVKGTSLPKEKLTMGYLEHGFGWTPSYLISLVDDTHAQITMQAVVTDDAEDIEDADLFFVVGVPNFAYAGTMSPMSLQQSLVDFMRDAKDSLAKKSVGMFSNALQGQAIALDERESAPISLTPSVDDSAGAPEEDLFLYRRSGVTLARGDRASYNIFSGSVAYEHIYNWEVENQARVDAFGNVINPNQNTPEENRPDSVWHAIRLKNSTRFPWTSAPALVISGDKPVSQDTLSYTPKNASTTMNITVATDIRASHEEREVARQQELNHRRNYNYDLVTIEGKLKVKNYKSKDVRLSIGKTLRGKVESQSGEGKSVELGEGIESDNPTSRMTWELTLKPGEDRLLTYRYKIWVRA